MAAISTSDLFKAYLAYFGRPPDVAGVTYYTTANGGLSEEAVVNGFSASAESQAFFGSMPLAQQIDQIYMNLFNRHVEAEGLTYWMARIQGDTIVNGVVVPKLNLAAAAMGILRGAQNGDLNTVNAKLAAVSQFVAAMDTPAEWSGYAGAEAAADARAFIAGVDATHIPTASDVAAAVLTATTVFVEPPPPAATLDVTASTASANEGSSVLFTVTTTNVAPGTTYSYSISGIEAADLDGGSLSGTVTIDSEGKAVVSVNLKADALTEGNQTLTFAVNGDTVAVTVVDSSTTPIVVPPPAAEYEVIASADSVNEGDTIVFTVNTANVAAGSVFSYTISGVNASDLDGSGMAGTVTIDAAGQAVVTVKLKADAITEGSETLTLTLGAGLASSSVDVADSSITPPPPPVVDLTLVATSGIDILNGGAGDDTFVATNATLQGGDRFNGQAGNDALEISISGNSSQYFSDSFETNSVETVSVKSLSHFGASLDMSDVNYADTTDGKILLESRETEGSFLVFSDIQNVNDTNLRIVDTDESHYFQYDAGSSASADNLAGGSADTANIEVQEMRGHSVGSQGRWYSGIDRANGDTSTTDDEEQGFIYSAAGVLLSNTDWSESYVDNIVLASNTNSSDPEVVTATQKNTMFLTSGQDLDTLTITGNADLEIVNTLDANIRSVDASAHRDATKAGLPLESADTRADLILDLSNSSDGLLYGDQNAFWTDDTNLDGYVSADNAEYALEGKVAEVTLTGSQGDDLITFGTTHNDKLVNLISGNDTLVAAGWDHGVLLGGEASVNGGVGNDVITVGNHNDIVIAGEGNDRIVDGGSTALWTGNGQSGSDARRYDADYSDYGNQFDLGTGNDTVSVGANSNDTVIAGEGNDIVDIDGSAVDGNAMATGWQRIDTIVDLGAGNDQAYIGSWVDSRGSVSIEGGNDNDTIGSWVDSRGSVSIEGGNGNDTIVIARDGDQTVNAGSGNDTVTLYQDENEFSPNHFDNTARDGNHKITLGEGDDRLLITGRSEVAVSSKTTDIDAGEGNDYVEIEQDHRLNVKLGNGDDTLQLRAQDLQSNDTIQGGNNYLTDAVNGYDTIILTNESDQIFSGEVRDSETRKVFAIEQFNLVDSNIRLHITDNLVETALNKTVVVNTSGAERGEFPIDLYEDMFQGMDYDDWVAMGSPLPPGLEAQRTPNPDPAKATLPDWDLAYFLYEGEVPTQTVDLTQLNTVDYTFKLEGGSLRDVVVVDEDALSADLYLDFGTSGDDKEGWAATDTLQVVDGANIRAADLENVEDLEVIELVATSNIAQTWVVELNNHVINQPTGTEPLVIRIDPNVPAGSKVYVVFSENNTNLAANNVIVERNSNVQVYIVTDQGALDYDLFLAHEDQYNTDVADWHFNGSGFGVVVQTAMYFTDNADNLHGTGADDRFIATTLDQVQAGDDVDGNIEWELPGNNQVEGDSKDSDFDTVELRFAVAAQNNTLQEQLSNANLWDIEHIEFVTENQVQLTGLEDSYQFSDDFATDLTHLTTGTSSDRLQFIERSDLWFTLNEGNDYLSFDADWNESVSATVSGGPGLDTVVGTDGEDSLTLGSVETVLTGDGDDVVTFTRADDRWGNTLGGNDGNVYVDLGEDADTLNLDDNGTNGTVTVWNTEEIFGGTGSDSIVAYINDGSDDGIGDSMVIRAGSSADAITAWGTVGTQVSVFGENGNDVIRIDNGTQPGGYGFSDFAYASGGSGADTITVGSASPFTVVIDGGEDNDVIYGRAVEGVSIEGGNGNDAITAYADRDPAAFAYVTVGGGSGNDTITVHAGDYSSVTGGSGNDLIDVTSGTDGVGSHSIWGNEGNDTISVHGVNPTFIDGGADAGNDLINLQALGGNVDTIVFGDVGYSALQVKNVDTQGVDTINNFNFEDGPGPDPLDPGVDDVLDFGAFLTGSKAADDFNGGFGGLATPFAVAYDDWTGGVNSLDMDDVYFGQVAASKIAVVTVQNTFSAQDLRNSITLDTAGTNGTMELNDGSRTVVILAKDSDTSDAIVGYDLFEVYYVQDIDTSANSAVWAVDHVATINATTAVGSIAGSVGVNQFVW